MATIKFDAKAMVDQRDTNSNQPGSSSGAAADHTRYLLHSRVEITALLTALSKVGTMVTAKFDAGDDFILTTILAVKPEQNEIVLEYGADTDANQRILKAGKIIFLATHERINIQFTTNAINITQHDKQAAFSIPIPKDLLRLQRREYFRITTPITRPPKCTIPPQAGLSNAIEVPVVDISCGGMAIIIDPKVTDIRLGTTFHGCKLQLPEFNTVNVNFQLRSTYEITLRNGNKNNYFGCEFINTPDTERSKIQRYINKVERERITRSIDR